MTTLIEQTARAKLAHYFVLLKESMAAEGGKVSKSAEWERCIEHWIEDGDAPAVGSKREVPALAGS